MSYELTLERLRLNEKYFFCLLLYQGSRDDISVGGGTGGVIPVARHGNSVDASFSKEVLNSITGSSVWCVCSCLYPVSI